MNSTFSIRSSQHIQNDSYTPFFQNFKPVVAQWCNCLILQPEESGRVGLIHGRALSLERHDKGSRQTAEYGKCTPETFFLKYHCTPEKGCGTLKFGCGSIV